MVVRDKGDKVDRVGKGVTADPKHSSEYDPQRDVRLDMTTMTTIIVPTRSTIDLDDGLSVVGIRQAVGKVDALQVLAADLGRDDESVWQGVGQG